MQSFNDIQIEKGQPGVGAVHATTALGNSRKGPKKATDFKAILGKRGVYRGVEKHEGHTPKPGDKITVDSSDGNARAAPFTADVLAAHGWRVRLANAPEAWLQLDPKNLVDAQPGHWRFAKAAGEGDGDEGGARHLRPMDNGLAHTPFPHDPNVLGSLRHDQVPKFFGALTDPQKLPVKSFDHKDLVAMQDRVDPAKVESMRDKPPTKKPVVVQVNGRHYIADGHHRASADYLNGEDSTKAHFLDLDPKTNTVKRADLIPLKITKADPESRMLFGYASVAERGGELVIDKQGDIIPIRELEKAVYDYMLFSREGDDMHVGHAKSQCIESMVFTEEKCKALNIDLPKDDQGRPMQAWWTGFYVEDDNLWAACKAGNRPEFSIGGCAVPIEV